MELDIINIVAETMSAVKGGGIYEFSGNSPLHRQHTQHAV